MFQEKLNDYISILSIADECKFVQTIFYSLPLKFDANKKDVTTNSWNILAQFDANKKDVTTNSWNILAQSQP